MHMDMKDAKKYIEKKLYQAPNKLKTKMKNFVHSIAINLKVWSRLTGVKTLLHVLQKKF